MNHLAGEAFSFEDRVQFAQLIGYSWSGAKSLSYFPDSVSDLARAMYDSPERAADAARIALLQTRIKELEDVIRNATVTAFDVCREDLNAP